MGLLLPQLLVTMARMFLIPHKKSTAKQIETIFGDNLCSWCLDYDKKYKIVKLYNPPTESQLLLVELLYEDL
jgi:hypothetical protein